MVSTSRFRLGVADDPTALQPTLPQCLAVVREEAAGLMVQVLQGLAVGAHAAAGPRRIAAVQEPAARLVLARLEARNACVAETFRDELERLMYAGGGKEETAAETLRFEDLRLFEDERLDQSIEVARAQQQVLHAVEDVLPALDALVSTLLGWRTSQPGLNPLRPDVFVRALLATLQAHVPEASARAALANPAAGLLGAGLRELYRELAAWLRSTGVEPAVPPGGRIRKGREAARVNEGGARTLLTLERLRQLLAGDFDPPRAHDDLLTVPASMALLQDLKQVDALVKRLEERPPPAPVAPAAPVDMLAPAATPAPAGPRIGQQLGREVVRLLFDHLVQDGRLLPAMQAQLRRMEPAVQRLARHDSRFFGDRHHPAREFLDRIAQRSLAFASEQEEGWPRFLASVEAAARWLDSKVVDADVFRELLRELQAEWERQDEGARARRQEAARALLHAEERNLLARQLAAEFDEILRDVAVPDFVREFLRNAWSQVVAEAQLGGEEGASDPHGYRALVDDLVWSVQRSTAQRGRSRRLVQMIPPLLERLAEGLQRIGYPPELTQRFFDGLLVLHRDAVQQGRDPDAVAAAEAAWSESRHGAAADDMQPWLDPHEATGSGYVEPAPSVGETPPGAAPAAASAPLPGGTEELAPGAWVELRVGDEWVRAQLTWASPHGTLFMFTALRGTAHSMSRRTLERLRATGALKVVAGRPVVDEALDHVARAALKNSL